MSATLFTVLGGKVVSYNFSRDGHLINIEEATVEIETGKRGVVYAKFSVANKPLIFIRVPLKIQTVVCINGKLMKAHKVKGFVSDLEFELDVYNTPVHLLQSELDVRVVSIKKLLWLVAVLFVVLVPLVTTHLVSDLQTLAGIFAVCVGVYALFPGFTENRHHYYIEQTLIYP